MRPSPKTIPERRSRLRLPDSLVVRHRTFGSYHPKERSVSIDLSEQGLSLPSSRRPTQRSVLEVEILIPAQELPVFALGEVVWIREAWESARRLWQLGLRITDMDETDEDRIRQYIRGRMEDFQDENE